MEQVKSLTVTGAQSVENLLWLFIYVKRGLLSFWVVDRLICMRSCYSFVSVEFNDSVSVFLGCVKTKCCSCLVEVYCGCS